MRISDNMTYNDFLKNLTTNTNKVQKTMSQLSSFKEVSKSSDNPLLVSKIMDLNVSLAQNKTYASTISDGISWSQTQYSALSGVTTSMQRISTLIQSSANASTADSDVKANKDEVEQLISGVVDSLNTNFDGRYVFGGQNTTTVPFEVEKENGEITGIKYNGTAQDLPREIAKGVGVNLFADGTKLTDLSDSAQTGENISGYFNKLITALNSDDKDSLSGDLLKENQNYTDNFTNVQAKISTITTRLQAASSRNETEKSNLTDVLSDKQDVDVAQKYMEYQNQMTSYKATLAMGTKIMQTTILDYLN
ncbi:flagellar hook associated protein [Liquorilactobacillus aquaticus DSM 21051]|uniref:Flagellar hook associated protein n=4 Tax=Liquorilactobacillus TaxID=2767888 RepID=A0A0R2D4I4_9LACO|nr:MULTISPECIES: flagellar hook-associated protein FlgL [Liquorilactobacillus]AJA33736.1 flagellar hook-associated protein 3 FlgL [Liquorilactobacillus aquaticus]AJA34400.1 flagellar hook-associated protein 3 FlgL [Liquorilactobacillus uvarum DSM 19971]KRL37600.1 flagellar hook associated protein [Liquorilactobacillus uvarum DSM 19971]KRM96836.1 flagellar hook associated protein [Liquorilactobacillus aquaticus DSM 21051]